MQLDSINDDTLIAGTCNYGDLHVDNSEMWGHPTPPLGERTRCEVWTRVMGYHRPVSSWNKGKQAEHMERCYFREVCES